MNKYRVTVFTGYARQSTLIDADNFRNAALEMLAISFPAISPLRRGVRILVKRGGTSKMFRYVGRDKYGDLQVVEKG